MSLEEPTFTLAVFFFLLIFYLPLFPFLSFILSLCSQFFCNSLINLSLPHSLCLSHLHINFSLKLGIVAFFWKGWSEYIYSCAFKAKEIWAHLWFIIMIFFCKWPCIYQICKLGKNLKIFSFIWRLEKVDSMIRSFMHYLYTMSPAQNERIALKENYRYNHVICFIWWVLAAKHNINNL